jgi:hypothetical protein
VIAVHLVALDKSYNNKNQQTRSNQNPNKIFSEFSSNSKATPCLVVEKSREKSITQQKFHLFFFFSFAPNPQQPNALYTKFKAQTNTKSSKNSHTEAM